MNSTSNLVIVIKPRAFVYLINSMFSFKHNLKFLFLSKERVKRKQLKLGSILKAMIWRDGKIPPALFLKKHGEFR